MRIAFTICANNYLARAKVVRDTFLSNHPDYTFFLLLTDKAVDSIHYDQVMGCEMIEAGKVVQNIEELSGKFNIVELSTSIKPAVFQHLFKTHSPSVILYLDPDIMVFDRFTEAESLLESKETTMVITPHFCSPIDDGKFPSEIDFEPFGLFNLGFIGLQNNAESGRFLTWWHERLMKYGYNRPHQSMFTDQLWVNFAPLFFEGVAILKHPGYNMANWNLYERWLTKEGIHFIVNKEFRLKFFHFSHYMFNNADAISKYQNRFTLKNRPDLLEIFINYRQRLSENKQELYGEMPGYYQGIYDQAKEKETKANMAFSRRLKRKLGRIFKAVFR